ncbi:MAG TPA: M28 family metallopeptidase [Blastocatellia bacterium]|jgi:Zn-dependent M28 family amino/carboxypeptidase|nr:M28 family metallopeptidase [Blastocatellia bacterium]
MKRFTLSLCSIVLISILALMGSAQKRAAQKAGAMGPPKAVLDTITKDRLINHIKVLASDEYEGRGPGTRGEELSINYIADQFKQVGLAPGNTDGTYFQKVPLVGINTSQDAEMRVKAAGKDMKLKFGDDFVARTVRVVDKTSFDADMVFVGYGVVAPEYGWDDYKGADVRGKVLIMLVNDPRIPDPKDPSKLDNKMFKGAEMTYYGRWTYKYEIAAEKGAAGVLVVHETEPAAYPWAVPKGSFTIENFDLVSKDNNMSRVNIEGWITSEKTRELFGNVGMSFDAMKKAAIRKDFKPVPLNARAKLTVENKIRRIESNNVVGKLEGSDPKLKDEYVIYTAHWDHLGIGLPDERGDKIYNGALDNASGCAGLIEIARAMKALPKPPARSILFLAVTAEEKGLIGSKYYAENPVYPLDKTVAAINMDGLNQWGPTRDVTVIGLGNSTLDDVLRQAAAEKGRTLRPDPAPEKGSYYRSDHFNFAKEGVPALYPKDGVDFIGKPADFGKKKRDEFIDKDYHKPSDEIKPEWDLSGAAEDLRLLVTVGYRVANADKRPRQLVNFKIRR